MNKGWRQAVAPHSPAGRHLSWEEAIEIDRSLAEVERQLAEARAAVKALKNGSLTGLRNRKPNRARGIGCEWRPPTPSPTEGSRFMSAFWWILLAADLIVSIPIFWSLLR